MSTAADAESPVRLRIAHVSKSFGNTRALRDVSLEIAPGEIHALVGENGAGKSTLINVIGGILNADLGTVENDGVPQSPAFSEDDAIRLGIGIVHQERALVPQLSIAENMFGAAPPMRFGLIDHRAMYEQSAEVLSRLGVRYDTRMLVQDISPAQQQLVEIAKVLTRKLSLLILDEPTASLSQHDTDVLFGVVNGLVAEGVSVLYVSHRLGDVFQLASSVTVLRDGQVTAQRRVAETTPAQLIRDMVGRDVAVGHDARVAGQDLSTAPVVLSVEGGAVPGFCRDVSFDVRAGEIVCVAGLIGSGRTEVCEAIVGATRLSAGTVTLAGRAARFRDPSEARAAGLGLVPEDRAHGGLFLDMSIADNIASANLPELTRRGLLSAARLVQLARAQVARLRIVPGDVTYRAGSLSGGNQQKVLLAKWLVRHPTVLIVDEPTRGVDVGAREEIYTALRELTAQGTGVLVVSSDLQEILGLADRVVVMAAGRTVGELDGSTATEESILHMMSETRSLSTMEST